MSANTIQRGARGDTGLSTDVGEIQTLTSQEFERPVAGPLLAPEENAVSLPQETATPDAIALLTRFLGPLLTVANPAWSIDPISRMRALQKKLVEYSLTREEGERTPCLKAISVVEKAVKLRLRFQQMRMQELETILKDEKEKQHENENKTRKPGG